MLKDCVILNGAIINVGAWNHQYTEIDGKQVPQNPLPLGATVEQRDMEHDHDRGWHEAGTTVLDPDAELYKAISAATDFNSLRAALLGNGKLAKVSGKLK